MFSDIRNKAKDTFSKIGYPSTKKEMWRYTNIKNFDNYTSGDTKKIDYKSGSITLPEKLFNIIIYNGHLIKSNPDLKGVTIQNYDDLMDTSSFSAENFLQVSNFIDNGVVAHNTSEFTDALHLIIGQDYKLETPINIISITNKLESNKIIFPRIYVHAEENSCSKIYIQHMNCGSECAINSVIEFFCEDSSKIEIIELSDLKDQEVINSIFFHQKDNSQINFFSTALGGKLYRSNINVEINGENCNNNFGVLILGSNKDHIDYHTNINHLLGRSKNHFSCKSLLKDDSKGIFNGRILVSKGASGSKSKLNNNNILLSERSQMQSNPQLEINCEDVKCSHGSTTGNLSKDELFYLRSRGINEDHAKKILVQGFIDKLLLPFDLEFLYIKDRIKAWI